MNKYNDLKMLDRMKIENQILGFLSSGEKVKEIPIGVTGDKKLDDIATPSLKEKMSIQAEERKAARLSRPKKKSKKGLYFKKVKSYEKMKGYFLLKLECGHQKKSLCHDESIIKTQITSRCEICKLEIDKAH
jgi:hypothetical protein